MLEVDSGDPVCPLPVQPVQPCGGGLAGTQRSLAAFTLPVCTFFVWKAREGCVWGANR